MVGNHIIVDMFGINIDKIVNINKNEKNIQEWNFFIKLCFDEANISLLNTSWHNFDNNGAFTVIYLLAESHLSLHTPLPTAYFIVTYIISNTLNLTTLSILLPLKTPLILDLFFPFFHYYFFLFLFVLC